MITTDCRQGPFNWVSGIRCNPVNEKSGNAFDNVEPRTGNVLAKVPVSGKAEVNRAVKAAKEAFKEWEKVRLI